MYNSWEGGVNFAISRCNISNVIVNLTTVPCVMLLEAYDLGFGILSGAS